MPWANDRQARRRSDAAYGSPEYRRNRTAAMRRDNWRCQLRLPGCAGAASQCDHIIGVAEGGTHALANLQAVCRPCHDRKTAQQGRGYRTGRTARDPAPRPRTAW
jgi:5-methylcytosine-specific restriction endonuclease McrA